MTRTTFIHVHVFFIIRILSSVNVEMSRFSDIALTANHLPVSSMSSTLVTNIGRSNDKRSYFSSSSIEVRPFKNRSCNLNTNAPLQYNFTLAHLIILNVSACVFFLFLNRILSLHLFRRCPLTPFFFQGSAIHSAIFYVIRNVFHVTLNSLNRDNIMVSQRQF